MNYYNYSHVAELRQATIGKNVRISPTASFTNGRNLVLRDRARIGANVSLWAGSGTARIVIGEDALLAPNVMITAANYRFNDGAPINDQGMDEADIRVGRDVWIGYGATVLPGATIGDGAIIGAGAVVRDAVPSHAIVAAPAAPVVGYRLGGPEANPGIALSGGAANTQALAVIRRELKDIDDTSLRDPLDQVDIDSFDLISLRTAIEAECGAAIPDNEWAAIRTLEDIARLPVLRGAEHDRTPALPPAAKPRYAEAEAPQQSKSPGSSRRRYALNMPQMALSGLSESWAFKELGDVHWDMITTFLRAPSSAIRDDLGDRLYATFTRFRLQASPTLRAFRENAALEIASSLERFGGSMFFSKHEIGTDDAACHATVMSTFAKYGERGKNTSLIKGSPTLIDPETVPSLAEFPEFGTEYRARRTRDPDTSIFECEYEILPPHDINGVGLLYFAAYPTIFDLCLENYEGKGFLMNHSTAEKDIFYFANSEPNDTLVFKLHKSEQEGEAVRHVASLFRKSDMVRMAEVTSIKQRI